MIVDNGEAFKHPDFLRFGREAIVENGLPSGGGLRIDRAVGGKCIFAARGRIEQNRRHGAVEAALVYTRWRGFSRASCRLGGAGFRADGSDGSFTSSE